MDLKYRKLITRIKPLHRIIRCCMYNSGIFFYKKIYRNCNYEKVFEELKDSKKGKRCFIIGNGPSLSVEDLNLIKNYDSIGTNEIHRIFDKTEWRPTYYLIMDRYSKSTPEQIRDIDCKLMFLGDYYVRFNNVLRKKFVCLHQKLFYGENRYRFSSDISRYIVNSPTVSYGAMQIMAYLGYSEIILLGFDHSYSFEFDNKGRVINTGNKDTHFFKDDNPSDIIGNVWGMTKAYEAFDEYARKNNIVVKNATRGGKLEVFERVSLESLLENK